MTPADRAAIDAYMDHPTAENLQPAVFALCRDAAQYDDRTKEVLAAIAAARRPQDSKRVPE